MVDVGCHVREVARRNESVRSGPARPAVRHAHLDSGNDRVPLLVIDSPDAGSPSGTNLVLGSFPVRSLEFAVPVKVKTPCDRIARLWRRSLDGRRPAA